MDRKLIVKRELDYPHILFLIIMKYDFYLVGQLDVQLEVKSPLNCILQLLNDKIVCGGGNIKIWDRDLPVTIDVGRRKKIHAMEYYYSSTNKLILITHTYLHAIKIWCVESHKYLGPLYFNKESSITCFKMLNNKIAFGFINGDIQIWDMWLYILDFSLKGHIGGIYLLSDSKIISSSCHMLNIWRLDECVSSFYISLQEPINMYCELPNNTIAYKYTKIQSVSQIL